MQEQFMNLAFDEANKAFINNEVPIGAVIVKNGNIISLAHNNKESENCSLYHAELIAIKKASEYLNNWRLDGCDIYITLDPCPMCASAIKQSRISNVYSALENSDTNYKRIIEDILLKSDSVSPSVSFSSNLAVEKSKNILNKFFKKQRNK